MSAKPNGALSAARWADAIFAKEGIRLTLGGEPTYVPENPEGAEWSFSAVGPTKLSYARRMADELLKTRMAGGVVFFSPGKQYPGEVNPRWALRMVARRDGKKLFRATPSNRRTEEPQVLAFLQSLPSRLGLDDGWMSFADPKVKAVKTWVLPLDHDDQRWISAKWKLKPRERVLTAAEGPAGLRLPLYLLPSDVPGRALVAELNDGRLHIFFPPLSQSAFTALVRAVGESLAAARIGLYELQGYVPQDVEQVWKTVGLTADPGVLEINLPPCADWQEYDGWIHEVTACAERCGLRSWKQPVGEYPSGTGGGNHLLWGGPGIDENPFFSRPAWLASILRHFQRHPSLAYLFTGCYVGASSQAPRPDESSKELFDLEMAYHFLETLPPGDHRALINETLRHLQTDVTGNAHRSETSFDKFWNPGWPGGCLGLIEFRAVESLPSAEWMSAVMLLWRCIAALAIVKPAGAPLRVFREELRDRYFMPACLLADLDELLDELRAAGCEIPRAVFRRIWEWRFPLLLPHREGDARLEVRRAHESWPLLCETPVEGGSTSRFVDTSMHRLEVRANDAFARSCTLYVQGRRLPLTPTASDVQLAGLRYRRSCLYPCLHPGIPIHLPLDFVITDSASGEPRAAYRMDFSAVKFSPTNDAGRPRRAKPCRAIFKGALTFDLRLD
ncbi:MAG: transglutaminase family protein [Terrimicrobiaceae bacterium]|nr:transglutaminase family protein [Terrimicrobiaceae bacterium]